MGIDQPECGAGRASPAKWSNTNIGEKKSEAVDRRAVGCKLVVLKMACSQSGSKVQWHFFSVARTSNSRCVVLSALFSLKMRCACHFILNEVVRNSSLELH
jgi:hypothetical protein